MSKEKIDARIQITVTPTLKSKLESLVSNKSAFIRHAIAEKLQANYQEFALDEDEDDRLAEYQVRLGITKSMHLELEKVENKSAFIREAIAEKMKRWGMSQDDCYRLKDIALELGLPLEDLIFRILKTAIKDYEGDGLRLDYAESFADLLPRSDRLLQEVSRRSGVDVKVLRAIRSGQLTRIDSAILERINAAL